MRQLIVGNWKMNGISSHLGEIDAVAAAVAHHPPHVDVLICPPATLITRAITTVAGRIAIGGQTCHPEADGAYTGEISAEMLADAGASAVIVGHSERRRDFGETNADVAAKARAAVRAGLTAIICIGETDLQRRTGEAFAACRAQIIGSVPSTIPADRCAIGYEPLWAIGTGSTPTAEEILKMHAHIRQCLDDHLGIDGHRVRILYGGSVEAANAAGILALPGVDGALVGHASLTAADFLPIVRAAPAGGPRRAPVSANVPRNL